jgi:hypothetical protein
MIRASNEQASSFITDDPPVADTTGKDAEKNKGKQTFDPNAYAGGKKVVPL